MMTAVLAGVVALANTMTSARDALTRPRPEHPSTAAKPRSACVRTAAPWTRARPAEAERVLLARCCTWAATAG